MRKRKDPPLGHARAVRTIPISAAEPVKGRAPISRADPALADLAEGLLPPNTGATPAAWQSWSPEQASEPAWTTPMVDGVLAGGFASGFDATALTAEVTSAAQAGWSHDPAQAATDSWLRRIADLDAGAPASTSGDRGVFAPRAGTPTTGVKPAARVDGVDFVDRFERGVALTLDEQQLVALTKSAITRLAPKATSVWLSHRGDDTLMAIDSLSDDPIADCRVRSSNACPALLTSTLQRFDRSDELDACPRLRAAAAPACAAVCVPVSTPGPWRGVLFVRTPVNAPIDVGTAELLGYTALTVADRLAQLRDEIA